MSISRPQARAFSVLFLVLLLICLVYQFWTSHEATIHTGPTHLSADSQQVFVIAAEQMYHLSSQGELLGIVSYEQLGITDMPIDLRLIDKERLLIASQRPAEIRVCKIAGWRCAMVGAAITNRPERQFKLATSGQQNVLWVTDAKGDALWQWNLSNSEAISLLPTSTLAGPNDIAFDQDGNLWIADTDHRQLLELTPTHDGGWEMGRIHNAMNEYTNENRYYPMMMALGADGHWWVTQASEFSDDRADLLVYDLDDGAIANIDLPGSVLATDVARMGNHVLVTDMETYQLYQVDTKTRAVSIFGDAAFNRNMAALQNKKYRLEWWSQLAMAGVVIFGILMIIAAFLATPADKRWKQPEGMVDLSANSGDIPETRGIHWLSRDEKIDRQLRLLPALLIGLIGIAVLGAGLGYLWIRTQFGGTADAGIQQDMDQLGLVMLASVPGLFVVVAIVHHSMKSLKNQLGTDGKQVHIRLGDGRQLSVSPSRLNYSKRAIFYRQHTLPVQGARNQSLYQQGEVETWIVPLLKQATKMNEWEAIKYQWKHHDFLLLWTVIVGVAGGIALILLF